MVCLQSTQQRRRFSPTYSSGALLTLFIPTELCRVSAVLAANPSPFLLLPHMSVPSLDVNAKNKNRVHLCACTGTRSCAQDNGYPWDDKGQMASKHFRRGHAGPSAKMTHGYTSRMQNPQIADANTQKHTHVDDRRDQHPWHTRPHAHTCTLLAGLTRSIEQALASAIHPMHIQHRDHRKGNVHHGKRGHVADRVLMITKAGARREKRRSTRPSGSSTGDRIPSSQQRSLDGLFSILEFVRRKSPGPAG